MSVHRGSVIARALGAAALVWATSVQVRAQALATLPTP